MTEKIFEVEHKPGEEIVLRFRTAKLPVFPESARSHFWAAEKEGLLALRDLIDAAIDTMEKAGKPQSKERTKVEVE